MKCWKFLVGEDEFRSLPSNPDLSFAGCVAVVLAETEAEARMLLGDYARASQPSKIDARWLEVADVTAFDLALPGVITWSQT